MTADVLLQACLGGLLGFMCSTDSPTHQAREPGCPLTLLRCAVQ